MRVLAIVPTYLPRMGGAENAIATLYTGLAKKDISIDLVTPYLGGKRVEKCGKFTIYRVYHDVASRIMKLFLFQWYEYRKIKKLMKEHTYDLVHCEYILPNGLVANWAARKLQVPLVYTLQHFGTGMDICSNKENPIYARIAMKFIIRSADKIIASSRVQQKFGKEISSRQTEVISLGAAHNEYTPKNALPSLRKKHNCTGIMYVCVCRLQKRKNLPDLIEAMNSIVKKIPNAKLIIVGTGPEKENLTELIKQKGLKKNITLTGFVSEKDLKGYYATADLFLFTSKFEGFGLVYCEALASGTPVISYDIDAAKEIITPGVGILVKQNPAALAQATITLSNDKKKRTQMSKKGVMHVRTHFTWDKHINEYAKLFKRLINEKT